MSGWEALERSAPDAVEIGGVEVRRGSRVRLRPRAGADVFDLALDGRVAVVESIEQDIGGRRPPAWSWRTTPAATSARRAQPGHRFFFAPDEVEPLPPSRAAPRRSARVLVAGIGNVFLGDDGFGVALAAPARAPRPARRR